MCLLKGKQVFEKPVLLAGEGSVLTDNDLVQVHRREKFCCQICKRRSESISCAKQQEGEHCSLCLDAERPS